MARRLVSWKEATNEINGWARIPSTFVNALSLAANVAETFTWPDFAEVALLSATTDYYTNTLGTAAVPGDVTNGTASELNTVTIFRRLGDTTFSVISPAACVITASFYS